MNFYIRLTINFASFHCLRLRSCLQSNILVKRLHTNVRNIRFLLH
jgi:hypothetical protein